MKITTCFYQKKGAAKDWFVGQIDGEVSGIQEGRHIAVRKGELGYSITSGKIEKVELEVDEKNNEMKIKVYLDDQCL